MSLAVADDRVVTIHYRLTNDAGEELDASTEDDPMTYLHGAENIVPGLEAALLGAMPGDTLSVTVAPEDGYGLPNEHDPIQVDREELPDGYDWEPGMALQAEVDDGEYVQLWITGVDGDTIHMTRNHPLAGVNLHFDVEILDVREATGEEIQHGHPHGPHGHHH